MRRHAYSRLLMAAVRKARRRIAMVTATTACAGVLAGGGMLTLAPAAQAEYYGGCTYSWGSPCYIVYGGMNYLITTDPDHAASTWGGTKPFNGYRVPRHDGVERDICGTIMYHPGTLSPYGWSCGWGEVVNTYPTIVGYSAIGGAEYYGIALYQMVNWGEYGPCGQVGSTC
jgi:hypothetical protein